MQAPKVKLGDRITALQQIVSPFGKVSDSKIPRVLLTCFNFNFNFYFSFLFHKHTLINLFNNFFFPMEYIF